MAVSTAATHEAAVAAAYYSIVHLTVDFVSGSSGFNRQILFISSPANYLLYNQDLKMAALTNITLLLLLITSYFLLLTSERVTHYSTPTEC